MPTAMPKRNTKQITAFVAEHLDGPAMIKIVLPRRIHREAIDDLRKMNITAATLFPGLDGFARSLRHTLRIFEGVQGGGE